MTPLSAAPVAQRVEHFVRLYGDLLFDLCESVLWNPLSAQVAFRAILKAIRQRSRAGDEYREHERSWVLSLACGVLRDLYEAHGRRLTPSEQIQLDATPALASRLRQFDAYFHRLALEDQLLLLLKDKYGLPYAEIAAAMGTPEGSLKIRRQQALRSLDEWIWESRP